MKMRSVVGFILSIVAFLFGIMPNKATAEEIIGGRLEILTVCQEKRSETFFSVSNEKERILLLIADPKIISELQRAGSGARVKIGGFWEKSRKNGDIRVQNFICREIISCERDLSPPPAKTSGESGAKVLTKENLLAVRIDFPDVPASALTKEEIMTAIGTLDAYTQEVSEGLYGISGEVFPESLTMPEKAEHYGYSSSNPMVMAAGMVEVTEIIISTIDGNYDFTKINRVAVILSGDGWRFALGTIGRVWHWTGDGYAEISWIWIDHRQIMPQNYFVFFHESFHNGLGGIGLGHARGMPQKEGYCQYCEQGECPVGEYGNPMSIMGGDGWYKVCHPSEEEKEWMRVAGEGRIKTVLRGEIVRLIPRASSAEGIKAIKIPTGEDWYYMLEYSGPVGFDGYAAFNNIVLLIKCGASFDPIALKSSDDKTPLDLEEGFCDPRIGLTVRIAGKGELGDLWADVEITLPEPPPPPPPCEEKPPIISVSSRTTEIYAGGSFTASISVENPMTEECGTRTVSIGTDLPAMWSASFSPGSVLEIAPQSVATASALVEISEGVSSGHYDLVFRAQDDISGMASTAILRIEVLPPLPPPPPPCEAEKIAVSPPILTLKVGETGDIAVVITGAEGCPIEGITVTATVILGKKRVSLPFSSGETDEKGTAIFKIAGKKKGRAIILFQASNLKILATAKVARK